MKDPPLVSPQSMHFVPWYAAWIEHDSILSSSPSTIVATKKFLPYNELVHQFPLLVHVQPSPVPPCFVVSLINATRWMQDEFSPQPDAAHRHLLIIHSVGWQTLSMVTGLLCFGHISQASSVAEHHTPSALTVGQAWISPNPPKTQNLVWFIFLAIRPVTSTLSCSAMHHGCTVGHTTWIFYGHMLSISPISVAHCVSCIWLV